MHHPIEAFVLIDQTTKGRLSAGFMSDLASALSYQFREHVGPALGKVSPSFSVATGPIDGAWPIVFLDDADQAGALGYHFLTPQGGPYSRVFIETVMGAGGELAKGALSVSAVASHEAIETFGDPWANYWVDTYTSDVGEIALELCDPVEDGAYEIGPCAVAVSNFVLPNWFDPLSKGPTFDYMGQLSGPLTATAGGYIINRTSLAPAAGKAGAGMSAARRASKNATGARALRRLTPRGIALPRPKTNPFGGPRSPSFQKRLSGG